MDLNGWQDAVSGTPIAWFQERMQASGITEGIAQVCGLKLKIGDMGAFFEIPYHDLDGGLTRFVRQRNRDEQYVRERGQSGGNFKGKYTQPKGQKNRLYWPPNGAEGRRILYNSPAAPMIITEGELKAIRCQMAIQAGGLKSSFVCGAPGTSLNHELLEELRNISCVQPALGEQGEIHRTVFLALDWNEKGQAREHGLELEAALRDVLEKQGARVVLLRWPVEDGAGRQALDEWLCLPGSDLGKAMVESLEKANKEDSELQEVWRKFNREYAICNGRYIPLKDPTQVYSSSDFNIMEANVKVMKSAKTYYKPHEVWGLQPREEWNEIAGIGFLPAPLGVEPEKYFYENGLRLLNVAPYVPIDLPPWASVTDESVAPFITLVARLCHENTEWFLNYLAHIAQRPMERTQHVVVFKDSGGTGKSALYNTLMMVFGEYAGIVGNALNSHFNGPLLGKTMAIWSEPEVRGGNDKHVTSAIKNLSGDEFMAVERKHKDAVRVRNYVRLFLATNNSYVVPVHKGERRWFVAGGKEAMSPEEWRVFKEWRDLSNGVALIRAWLMERDLGEFHVDAPAPITEQRKDMEYASLSPLEALLADEYFETKDIWTVREIIARNASIGGRPLHDNRVGSTLKDLGFVQRHLKSGGTQYKLWAIRGEWADKPNDEWVEEHGKPSGKVG